VYEVPLIVNAYGLGNAVGISGKSIVTADDPLKLCPLLNCKLFNSLLAVLAVPEYVPPLVPKS
jgi:hypothetical protein